MEREMFKQLMIVANELDKRGLLKEANFIDLILKKATDSEPDDEDLAPWQKGQWAKDRDALLESQKEEDPPFFSGEWAKKTEEEMRDTPVLQTGEIIALIKAHEDSSTDYKLNPYPGRLDGLQWPDLPDEEKDIVRNA